MRGGRGGEKIAFRLDARRCGPGGRRGGPHGDHPASAGHDDLCVRAVAGRPRVGVYAALCRTADTTFDYRSRGQVMADTLVAPVTGRPAETRSRWWCLVMSDQALLGGVPMQAVIEVWADPAAVARGWSARRLTDKRRGPPAPAVTASEERASVAMELRSWCFPRGLAGSSACVIDAAVRRIVTPRSGIATTRNRRPAAGLRAR